MFPVTKPQQCASAASLTSNVDPKTMNTTRFVVRNPTVDHNPPFTVCRVCLAMSVKMYHMSEHNLSVIYERVTGIEVRTDDKLPKMLCWECVARLTSANNLNNKALKTYWLLLKNINEGIFVTNSDIESIDRSQYQLESSLGFKYYEVNNTDLHIQSECDITSDDSDSSNDELLIIKYEDSDPEDELKSELLDITEQQEEADLQVPKPIIVIKEDESDEEVTIDSVSNASEASEEDNPIVDKDGSKGLPYNKEVRVVLEDVMLSLKKQNTQYCYNEITNTVSYVKAQSINKKETHSKINEGTLAKLIGTDRTSTGEADTNNRFKTVCAKTSTVNRNIDLNNSNKVFICDVCNKSFKYKKNLTQHIQRRYNLYNCTYCTFKTCNKSYLNHHLRTIHTKNISFNCCYCDYKASQKFTLSRHIITKHTKNTIYSCSYCSHKTYHRGDLTRHINCKHTKTIVYNCSYCSYKAYGKNALNDHVKAKHTKIKTVFDCPHCDYKTCFKSQFTRHVNGKHTKNVVFNCSYCEYKSHFKNYLTKHINRIHTKNTVFYCAHCSYKGYDRSNLCKHIKIMHNN